LIATALDLLSNAEKLEELSANVLALAERDSARRIADEVMKLVKQ
jgi:UDP-N-acetylglucosamine:LPS N-acetylglucosamine transferase